MNTDIKHHIDSARQVLVGVVPNPTSQIEQITNALIYKFMDDMDQAAIKAGGEPAFFVEDLEPYAWSRLMDTRIGNQERMNLYSEALIKFSQSKQLPELFRGIFKSAFLPYRSPETLGLFLKEINYFSYSHPEELGNAYEYLLSIMSSQGDAGQFRTPRHIIDFIVDVINPTKDDKVLDPACGTGGFLVSSYKHILEQHDGKDDPDKKERPLTPDERKKIMTNFEGYDIDPTMVRIAQVNMYLHQFKDPKIYQYNTLSMEERWGDKFDVILANPPFMSPKGGVPKSKKFGIDSNRSEVLFADYIINHLRPKGRAGIIVPEGIIFQSGTAYKALRKSLVNDGLYSVVSLPSGVFAPYSGVKTSILLFNNELAKISKEILFVKIENDGFDLGATKRKIDKNDIPQALSELKAYQNFIETGKASTTFTERVKKDNLSATQVIHHDKFILVKKSLIAENGDYNLSGDRYKPSSLLENSKWPMVELGEVSEVSAGNSAPQDKSLFEDGKYPFFRTSDVGAVHLSDNLREVRDWLNDRGIVGLKLFKKGTVLFPKSGASTFLNHRVVMGFDGYVSSHLATITPKESLISSKFIYLLLVGIDAKSLTPDQAYPSLKTSEIAKIKIPLPPIEIQEQIVKELDGYESIINGAKQIVQNWKPKIDIDPEWEKLKIGELVKRKIIEKPLDGNHGEIHPKASDYVEDGIPFIMANDLVDGVVDIKNSKKIAEKQAMRLRKGFAKNNDVLLTHKGTIGRTAILKTSNDYVVLTPQVTYYRILNEDKLLNGYLKAYFDSDNFQVRLKQLAGIGATRSYIGITDQLDLDVIIPPLEIQEQIVEEIEAERELVMSAKKLINVYEDKTKSALEKLYGQDD